MFRKIKNEGEDKTTHYPVITEEDITKLFQADSFDLTDPVQLQQKVFFDIQYNFARRGPEGTRHLKKSSFLQAKDEAGK